jgi:hypothetical protein
LESLVEDVGVVDDGTVEQSVELRVVAAWERSTFP